MPLMFFGIWGHDGDGHRSAACPAGAGPCFKLRPSTAAGRIQSGQRSIDLDSDELSAASPGLGRLDH